MDIEEHSKESLHKLRTDLKKRLESELLKEDPQFHLRGTEDRRFSPSYAEFLDHSAYLDLALKRNHWESADELASLLMSLEPYRNDRRCVRIVYTLLEEYDA